MQLIAALLLLHAGCFVGLFANGVPIQDDAVSAGELNHTSAEDALFLTPLIEAGSLSEAKALSKVGALPADVQITSYAGYITVNKDFNSNLFFWFVPSLKDPANAPVILWLQGGPGTTSLLGFFAEHGPYSVSRNRRRAQFRQLTWAKRYSMLYVDQPVGTGFSFTESESGFARNMTDVGRDMVEFLQQFFTLFGELAHNEFYMAGESYAGKYVPAIGAMLHANADTMPVKINFQGIAYGNGFTDPVNMIQLGEFPYTIGIVDRLTADYMAQVSGEAIERIRAGSTSLAFEIINSLMLGMTTNETFFKSATGMEYYYNFLYDKEPEGIRDYKYFVPSTEVRHALHVGQRYFATTRDVIINHFKHDFMRSAVPQLTVLLENGYKVLVYSGPLDISIPTTNTENFLSQIAWSRAARWAHARQQPWWSPDGQRLLGYKKSVDNLSFVVVRNSGHMVPYDQPHAAFQLLKAFIENTAPF